MQDLLLLPAIQYGFCGFSLLLLGVVVWLIKQLLIVLKATNKIIAANTATTNDLVMIVGDLMALSRAIHDKLISRPCIAKGERK